MKAIVTQKQAKKQNNFEQFYVIKIERINGNIEFLDSAFNNYSEARRTAQKIISKKNIHIELRFAVGQIKNKKIFEEISPDLWTNSFETVSVNVLKIKDLFLPKLYFKEIAKRETVIINTYEKAKIML